MKALRIDPALVIAPLAIVVALSGTAVAATGRPLLLGRHNTASTPTQLVNSNGSALRLVGRPHQPPLKVGADQTEVPSLNASLLGGATADALKRHRLMIVTPGTTRFTVPRTFHHMIIEAIGAGGGGGAGLADGQAGSGGGQGGVVTVWTPAAPGSVWTAVVGAGGAVGISGTKQPAGGGASIVTSPLGTLVTAGGGGGGFNGPACASGSTSTVTMGGGTAGRGSGPNAALHNHGAVGFEGIPGVVGGSSTTTCPDTTTAGAGGDSNLVGGGGAGGSASGAMIAPSKGVAGAIIVEFLR